jgi:aryl-alcohol dehydrogenase-like predicted oxidoreductase
MDHVNLGRSGLRVSRVCLGTFGFGTPAWQKWVLDEGSSRPIIKRALELGINFFDTADYYSNGDSETILGRALHDFARREEVVVCTKAFHPTGPSENERGLSRRHLFDAIDGSLRRLKMDHVDLYGIHRLDQTVPMEETLEALHDIVKSGRARYIAASNMVAWQFAKAIYMQDRRGWVRFIAIQNQYNLVYREEEREMLPLCAAEGIGYTPYSPLARGFLAGRGNAIGAGDTARTKNDGFISKFYSESPDAAIRARAGEIADSLAVNPAKVALAWLLRQPRVSAPVIGATKRSHVEDAVAAMEVRLTDEHLAYLEEPYRPRQVLLHL